MNATYYAKNRGLYGQEKGTHSSFTHSQLSHFTRGSSGLNRSKKSLMHSKERLPGQKYGGDGQVGGPKNCNSQHTAVTTPRSEKFKMKNLATTYQNIDMNMTLRDSFRTVRQLDDSTQSFSGYKSSTNPFGKSFLKNTPKSTKKSSRKGHIFSPPSLTHQTSSTSMQNTPKKRLNRNPNLPTKFKSDKTLPSSVPSSFHSSLPSTKHSRPEQIIRLTRTEEKCIMQNLAQAWDLLVTKNKRMRSTSRSTSSRKSQFSNERVKEQSAYGTRRTGSGEREQVTPEVSLLDMSLKILEQAQKGSVNKPTVAVSNLKKKIANLENEIKNLTSTYECEIRHLKNRLRMRKCSREECLCTCKKFCENYSDEQQQLMLEDYEKLIMTLDEEHQNLKDQDFKYKMLGDEHEQTSAEILKNMLDYLNQKSKYPAIEKRQSDSDQSESHPLSTSAKLNSSLVMFKPAKNLDSSANELECGDDDREIHLQNSSDSDKKYYTLNLNGSKLEL